MFRFDHPEILLLLIFPPIFLVVSIIWAKRKDYWLEKFGSPALLKAMLKNYHAKRRLTKTLFKMAGAVFLIFTLANPQWGTKTQMSERKGIDVILALDLSTSMLAADVLPNRLERAKRLISELIGALKGNRIGLIVFAGNAYLQVPLTTDYNALDLTLGALNPTALPTQGTIFGEAITLAEQSFDPKASKSRALILVTDGEDHEDGALEGAREAANKGLRIYTIGIGTQDGTYIPVAVRGRMDYKRDNSGNPVLTRLNTEMLSSLADAGNGKSYTIQTGNEDFIGSLINSMSDIEQQEFEQIEFTDYESYFQYFAAFGFIFLLLDFLIPNGKTAKKTSIDIFSNSDDHDTSN
jgi:Ca-activated chloride channel family protein